MLFQAPHRMLKFQLGNHLDFGTDVSPARAMRQNPLPSVVEIGAGTGVRCAEEDHLGPC